MKAYELDGNKVGAALQSVLPDDVQSVLILTSEGRNDEEGNVRILSTVPVDTAKVAMVLALLSFGVSADQYGHIVARLSAMADLDDMEIHHRERDGGKVQ